MYVYSLYSKGVSVTIVTIPDSIVLVYSLSRPVTTTCSLSIMTPPYTPGLILTTISPFLSTIAVAEDSTIGSALLTLNLVDIVLFTLYLLFPL